MINRQPRNNLNVIFLFLFICTTSLLFSFTIIMIVEKQRINNRKHGTCDVYYIENSKVDKSREIISMTITFINELPFNKSFSRYQYSDVTIGKYQCCNVSEEIIDLRCAYIYVSSAVSVNILVLLDIIFFALYIMTCCISEESYYNSEEHLPSNQDSENNFHLQTEDLSLVSV